MFENYLIPANTKRGKLIFGWFRQFDLYLFGLGILTTIVLLAFMPLSSTMMTILILSPALISAFLVMQVPYYHSMLNVIVAAYEFFTNRQTYRWKGWCYKSVKRKR